MIDPMSDKKEERSGCTALFYTAVAGVIISTMIVAVIILFIKIKGGY